ncbi:hypothetical protein F5Y10DRAFT_228559 [Nemania abortiva]|nr:hypothetical protein F5Y10DRAFT_228559 [Nemania abortiva]
MIPRKQPRIERWLDALAHQPMVEATANHAHALPNGNNLDDSGELGGRGRNVSNGPKDRRSPGPLSPDPKFYAAVLGQEVLIPRTSHFDTYDPDAPPPGTPESESHTPERYAAWGRKYFGEEWYEQREKMLQERNVFVDHDQIYKKRQIDLRVLEHTIEGRPSMPGPKAGFVGDKGWKRLWARISKNLPKPPSPKPPSDDGSMSSEDRSGDTDLSGYSTYDPTPSPSPPRPPRERTPEFDDPFDRLEFYRKRDNYSEEQYQFGKIRVRGGLIDRRRKKREDEPGDKRREKIREETEKIRFVTIDGKHEESREYLYLTRIYDYWKDGKTQEQIEAEVRENDETVKYFLSHFGDPLPEESEPKYDREQLEERYRAWESMGFSKEVQASLVRRLALPHLWPPSVEEDSRSGVLPPLRASPRQAKDRIRNGRVTKNAPQKKGSHGKSAVRRKSARIHGEAQPPSRGSHSSQPNIPEDPDLDPNAQAKLELQHGKKPRKTYTKERASRRLAGQPPEFAMLPGRGEMKTQALYEGSPQQHSNTRRTGRNTSKKPVAVQSAKPQGISMSRKPGRGRPKSSAK